MLSTHFSDYLDHEILQPLHASLTFKQMNVLLDSENGTIATPLFQVVQGVCQDSLGIRCARAFGMPREVTERAQQVRIKPPSRVDLRLHPRGQGGPDCSEFDRSEEGGADRPLGRHALCEGGLDEGHSGRGGAVYSENSRDRRDLDWDVCWKRKGLWELDDCSNYYSLPGRNGKERARRVR